MTRIAITLALAAFLALPAWAQRIPVDIGLQSAITYQALDHQIDDDSFSDIAPGFQNALGNITLGAELFDGGRAHVGLFISSKHHTEMWGYEGYFNMTKLPAWMKLGGFGEFYNEHLEVKAGQMALNFSDSHLYQSINGDVYNNELIGNPVAVPALVALGAEATTHFEPFHLLVGFSNGTTKGDLQEGKGIALHTKAWVTPFNDKVRLAASFYRVDHSGNGTGYPSGGTKSYLFSQGDRAGGQYDVWNGYDGGQVFFGKEQDVTVFQLDGRVNLAPVVLYGSAGWFRDTDCNGTAFDEAGKALDNGTPEDRWTHYMVTGVYNLTDWLYLAGRFSTARAATVLDVDTNGTINRMQVGAGFRLYQGILMKVEYVDQQARDFTEAYVNNGTNLALNPSFSGLSVQTAVKF